MITLWFYAIFHLPLLSPVNTVPNLESANVNEIAHTELIYMTIEPVQDSVKVIWVTENEQRIQSYELLYSADNKAYQPVGKVKAFNSYETVNFYQLIHAHPQSALSYYRLRAVYQNGQHTLLETRPFMWESAVANPK